MDEAHVEHAVGFVKNQDFHMGKIDGFLIRQIEQASRTGHQYVDTFGQCLDLGVHADAAKDHRAFKREVAGVNLEAVVNLCSELTGRR